MITNNISIGIIAYLSCIFVTFLFMQHWKVTRKPKWATPQIARLIVAILWPLFLGKLLIEVVKDLSSNES
jgi:hypothetical protein